MKRSQRFKTVLMLAQRKEDEAAKYLSDCRQRLDKAQNQHKELALYAEQYQLEVKEAGSRGVSPSQWQRYQQFQKQLFDAQETQVKNIALTQQGFEQATKQWQLLHFRRGSLEDLIKRLELEESAVLEKRLQQELDELSQLAIIRNQ